MTEIQKYLAEEVGEDLLRVVRVEEGLLHGRPAGRADQPEDQAADDHDRHRRCHELRPAAQPAPDPPPLELVRAR